MTDWEKRQLAEAETKLREAEAKIAEVALARAVVDSPDVLGEQHRHAEALATLQWWTERGRLLAWSLTILGTVAILSGALIGAIGP